MAKAETARRRLKPVIEKKRRDRINRNLDALRALLLWSTKDTRLQNPKLEKAEILDLAVQYIRKNTCNRTDKQGSITQTAQVQLKVVPVSVCATHHHQCVPDLTSFMGDMHPSERETVFESLECYLDSHQGHTSRTEREADTAPADHGTKPCSSLYHPYKTDLSFQESSLQRSALKKSILCTQSASPNLLSPPASPQLSSSPFITPPSSVASHLPFVPSLSPPLFAVPFSVSSSVKLSQLWQPQSSGDLPTSPCPSVDTKAKVINPAPSAWRPWS